MPLSPLKQAIDDKMKPYFPPDENEPNLWERFQQSLPSLQSIKNFVGDSAKNFTGPGLEEMLNRSGGQQPQQPSALQRFANEFGNDVRQPLVGGPQEPINLQPLKDFGNAAVDAAGLHNLVHPIEAGHQEQQQWKQHPVLTAFRKLGGPAEPIIESGVNGALRSGKEIYQGGGALLKPINTVLSNSANPIPDTNWASVGQHALRAIPFVGAAADTVNNELPPSHSWGENFQNMIHSPKAMGTIAGTTAQMAPLVMGAAGGLKGMSGPTLMERLGTERSIMEDPRNPSFPYGDEEMGTKGGIGLMDTELPEGWKPGFGKNGNATDFLRKIAGRGEGGYYSKLPPLPPPPPERFGMETPTFGEAPREAQESGSFERSKAGEGGELNSNARYKGGISQYNRAQADRDASQYTPYSELSPQVNTILDKTMPLQGRPELFPEETRLADRMKNPSSTAVHFGEVEPIVDKLLKQHTVWEPKPQPKTPIERLNEEINRK